APRVASSRRRGNPSTCMRHEEALSAIERASLADCAPAFVELGIEGTFARYLLARIPNAPMLRWTGAPHQVAISGAPYGHYEASFTWILGGRLEAAAAFVEHFAKHPHLQAYLPIAHADAIATAFPELVVSTDHVYTLDQPPQLPTIAGHIVELRADTELALAPDLQSSIPPPAFRRRADFPYWAVVEDDTVVAIAECAVDDGRFTVIQQVRTTEASRGRGLGRALVAAMCRDIVGRGRTAVYICAASNVASVALARSCGLSLATTLACVEHP
ncbi:MAG TPA: GNAT family N-acetyltransferase, partial [Nannocystaceae bacterium]|nr:GNAT family N-acetyltransferase [Nannocystaceae bacterium]